MIHLFKQVIYSKYGNYGYFNGLEIEILITAYWKGGKMGLFWDLVILAETKVMQYESHQNLFRLWPNLFAGRLWWKEKQNRR